MVLIEATDTDTFTVSNGFYIHQYNTPGTRNINVVDGGIIEVLVVAGGGGGGTSTNPFGPSGGGGGGEVVHLTSFTVRKGSVTVTVGAGGASNVQGGNSVFGNIQTNGGGYGGIGYGPAAGTGGSGGGAGREITTRAISVKLNANGMGFAGGISSTQGATGGGGATQQGGDRLSASAAGANGGAGYLTSISGVGGVYGSGGGGASRAGTVVGIGGTNAGNGGVGDSTVAVRNGTNAINGFGGGGGGSAGGGNVDGGVGAGGSGGSGVVIVRYYVGNTIYKPVTFTNIKAVLGTAGNNISTYRNTKVSYSGLHASLPSSRIAASDFVDRYKSIVTTGLVFFYDPAVTSSYPGTGTTLTDLSGNNRNGILQGGASVNSDKQIVLAGASQYISTTYAPNLDNNRLYTLELWFWDNTAGGFTTRTALISNFGVNTTTPHAGIHINATGTVAAGERNSSSVIGEATYATSVCNGVWTHIVSVATATQLILYVNGVNVATATRPGGVITSTMNIVIGGNYSGRFQTCRMGPVRMYLNNALSAANVLQNYEAERYRESLNV